MDLRSPTSQSDPVGATFSAPDQESIQRLPSGYSARLLTSVDQAEPYVRNWEELCAHALESNLFFEPWELLPAWRHLGDTGVRLLLLLSPHGHLHGLLPIRVRRGYRRLPLTTVGVWQHLHCPLCVPVIHRDAPSETLTALFEWLHRSSARPQVLILNHLSADGPFVGELTAFLSRPPRRRIIRESWERAVIRPHGDADAYLESALAGKRRKEFRRLLNRLGEKGSLEFVEMSAQDDLDQWLGEFFDLEKSGWKGRGGTAIVDREPERRYFEQIARAARDREQFMMLALRLDGRPIAMKCNFLADGGGYAAKIAFDETFAPFSPGVQLELHHIRLLHARTDIPWMDSCAIPNHFMIERLWTERRPMQSLAIGLGHRGNLALAALPALAAIRRRLKRKDTHHAALPDD